MNNIGFVATITNLISILAKQYSAKWLILIQCTCTSVYVIERKITNKIKILVYNFIQTNERTEIVYPFVRSIG